MKTLIITLLYSVLCSPSFAFESKKQSVMKMQDWDNISSQELYDLLTQSEEKKRFIEDKFDFVINFLDKNKLAIDNGDVFFQPVSFQVKTSVNKGIKCTQSEVLIIGEYSHFKDQSNNNVPGLEEDTAEMLLEKGFRDAKRLINISGTSIVNGIFQFSNGAVSFTYNDCSLEL